MFQLVYSNWMIVGILITVSLISGCATTPHWVTTSYGTMEFSHSEVEKLPIISIRKILKSGSHTDRERVKIFIRSSSLNGPAEVHHVSGQEDVIVIDEQGKEVRLRLADITEIKRIRRFKVVPHKSKAEAAGEVLIYAPLIPVAIATWPFLRAMGLDAEKNSDDDEKAQLAYGGMSKEDLMTYVGGPLEKYHCDDKSGGHEVWVYKKDQVLRGGRALFINVADGKVYAASFDTTFFKDSCSRLETEP